MINTVEDFASRIEVDIEPLLKKVSKDFREGLRKSKDGGDFHFGLGMFIRNAWHLWQTPAESEWVEFFNRHGIYHADDMSGIILCTYVRSLRHEAIEFGAQVKTYQDFWKKQNIDPRTGKRPE